MSKIRIIDLFAGLGGMRLGVEAACQKQGLTVECVMTSEIKPHAIKALNANFSHGKFVGDIFEVDTRDIDDFDLLLAGFPCQPFSYGGKRQGFHDTRGTLFFEIERILKEKKPEGFILENVEGLVKHDPLNKSDKIGRTLSTILYTLEKVLGYTVSWIVLDSSDFEVPQTRKRIYITGAKKHIGELKPKKAKKMAFNQVMESGLETHKSEFTKKLLDRFSIQDLHGKSIKDKRGGDNNIHSWDLALKGELTDEQIDLLNQLFRERRRKHWADEIGIEWMDGMPLTLEQIQTFSNHPISILKEQLDDLENKGYLRLEHPKRKVSINDENSAISTRSYAEDKRKGYNIVTGKLSFEFNKILDPNDVAPTLVATDISKIAVPDGYGLRRLSIREGLRLFGFPEWYNLEMKESEAFDLLGNTVVVPVVEHVASILLRSLVDQTKVD